MQSEMSYARSNRLANVIIIGASTLGMVQGLTWTILSFLSILYYRRHILPSISGIYFQSKISRTIYDFYLNESYEVTLKDTMKDYPLAITATPFFGTVLVYFCISVLWLAISVYIGVATLLKTQLFKKQSIGAWAVTTLISSLCDLVVMFLLAFNYSQINKFQVAHTSGPSAADTVILASTGVVMTIASRGFVLWIVNVIFAILMGNYCLYFYKGLSIFDRDSPVRHDRLLPWEGSRSQLNSVSSFYDQISSRPHSKLTPIENPRMVRAINNDMMENRFSDRERPTYPKPTRIDPKWSQNFRKDLPPPFIPEPDYTPPVSPIMRRMTNMRK